MAPLAMTITAELYALQEIDSAIDATRANLVAIQEQLGETEKLIASRQALAECQEALKELHAQQRDLEWQVDDLRSRLSPVEDKLYGGSVRNPKELSSLQEEAEILKAQLRRREDVLLNLMVQVEDSEAAVREAEASLAEVERGWQQEQQALLGRQARLEGELVELEERRGQQSGRIDARVLSLYEGLRQRRQGRAVAKVERGMCQGCRISLPMTTLQKARSGLDVVQCVSCERILYLS